MHNLDKIEDHDIASPVKTIKLSKASSNLCSIINISALSLATSKKSGDAFKMRFAVSKLLPYDLIFYMSEIKDNGLVH